MNDSSNPVAAGRGRQAGMGFIMVTVLIDLIGIGLIIPVLPGLVGQMTTSRDAQAYWYGALVCSFGLMQFLCAPFLGALSDRIGRRPLLLLGITGMGVNFLITYFATSLWLLLIGRLLGGALSANLAVATAYVADITAPEERAARFGKLGAAFGVGFILGPVIGGVLGEYDLRLPFLCAAGLSGLNVLYGVFVLPESLAPERRVTRIELARANPFAALLRLSELKGVGGLIVTIGLINLAQFILQTTWVLYTTRRFDWGPQQNGVSLFVVGISFALVQGLLLSRLLKWFGRRHLVLIGLTSATLAYIAYGLASAGWVMYVIIFCNLFAMAAGPPLQSIVSEAADASDQGATLGALSSLSSLMIVIAPVLGATLFAQVGHLPAGDWRLGAPFFLASLLAFLALLFALPRLLRDDSPNPATAPPA